MWGRGNTACGGGAVGGVTQHVGEGQWEGQHSMWGRGSGRGNTACGGGAVGGATQHDSSIVYSPLHSEHSLCDLCRW